MQTALQSDNQSVQYHALALLHQIKRQDRLAISKVVASLTRTPLKSALAQCLLIRFAKRVMEDDPSGENRDRALFDYLESSLRHKSDMVIYEAASAICSLTNVTQREVRSEWRATALAARKKGWLCARATRSGAHAFRCRKW